MASMLRWTQAQLDEYQSKRAGASQAPTCALSLATPSQTNKPGSSKVRLSDVRTPGSSLGAGVAAVDTPTKKAKGARTASRQKALQSLQSSVITGSHERGQWLELRFEGVKLLSINRLYGLTHFERIKYRKAWHQRVFDAVQLVVGGPRHLSIFDHFIIRAHRLCSRKADTDAKASYLKYAIDGLRYANAIKDDKEEYFRDLLCTQAKGPDCLILRIEQVPSSYVPVAERSNWLEAMTVLDSDEPIER